MRCHANPCNISLVAELADAGLERMMDKGRTAATGRVSMGEDEISEAGRTARFEQWEKLGVDAIRADLETTGGHRLVGGPPVVRRLAWEWVRMKQAERPVSLADLVPSDSLADTVAAALRESTPRPSTPKPSATPPPSAPPDELLILRPNFHGVGINLKELGRRTSKWARKWWQQRRS
jgi:hypothetical protein